MQYCGHCLSTSFLDTIASVKFDGISGSCGNCVEFNGETNLYYSGDCGFFSLDTGPVCNGDGDHYKFRLSYIEPGFWELDCFTADGDHVAVYVVESYEVECYGDTKFNLFYSSETCANWPETATVNLKGFGVFFGAGPESSSSSSQSSSVSSSQSSSVSSSQSSSVSSSQSSSVSSSQSSSSSDPCKINCDVILTLSGECSFEVTNGVVYSIGTQLVDVNKSDPCNCVRNILVNGVAPPTTVADGSAIFVSVFFKPQCTVLSQDGPTCVLPLFVTVSDGTTRKTYVKMSNLFKAAKKTVRRKY